MVDKLNTLSTEICGTVAGKKWTQTQCKAQAEAAINNSSRGFCPAGPQMVSCFQEEATLEKWVGTTDIAGEKVPNHRIWKPLPSNNTAQGIPAKPKLALSIEILNVLNPAIDKKLLEAVGKLLQLGALKTMPVSDADGTTVTSVADKIPIILRYIRDGIAQGKTFEVGGKSFTLKSISSDMSFSDVQKTYETHILYLMYSLKNMLVYMKEHNVGNVAQIDQTLPNIEPNPTSAVAIAGVLDESKLTGEIGQKFAPILKGYGDTMYSVMTGSGKQFQLAKVTAFKFSVGETEQTVGQSYPLVASSSWDQITNGAMAYSNAIEGHAKEEGNQGASG